MTLYLYGDSEMKKLAIQTLFFAVLLLNIIARMYIEKSELFVFLGTLTYKRTTPVCRIYRDRHT